MWFFPGLARLVHNMAAALDVVVEEFIARGGFFIFQPKIHIYLTPI